VLTEQDLQEALADAVDDPAAERLTLGLSDRALEEAGRGAGRRFAAGRRGRWASAIAVGSAFAVAAAVGMALLDGSGGSGAPATLAAPEKPANAVGQAGLAAFSALCFTEKGPKLDASYVWDPATRAYRGIAGEVPTGFYPSPDGKRALVVRGAWGAAQAWAVADWADAVAGRVSWNPLAGVSGVSWTADGREVVTDLTWSATPSTGETKLASRTADFYDPATGRLLAAVPIPQQVLTRVTGGQWSIQEFQGDHNAVLFPMLSVDGNRLEYLNAQGTVARVLTLQEGLAANGTDRSQRTESAQLSPGGRYLSEQSGSVIAVFDLQAGGKRIGWTDVTAHVWTGWISADQIVTVADKNEQFTGSAGEPYPLSGHSPVYSVLAPDLKVMQEVTFVLPADPNGACTTWPASFAPVGRFPGAFVP
jgi:hypothetical protein